MEPINVQSVMVILPKTFLVYMSPYPTVVIVIKTYHAESKKLPILKQSYSNRIMENTRIDAMKPKYTISMVNS